jgi:hypothetical protein
MLRVFINVLDEIVFQNPQILLRTHGLFPEQSTLGGDGEGIPKIGGRSGGGRFQNCKGAFYGPPPAPILDKYIKLLYSIWKKFYNYIKRRFANYGLS